MINNCLFFSDSEDSQDDQDDYNFEENDKNYEDLNGGNDNWDIENEDSSEEESEPEVEKDIGVKKRKVHKPLFLNLLWKAV